MGYLENLPLDPLVEILVLLQPLEIIRGPRKVCRTLHAASETKGLWIDVLKRVCKEENIFEATFPVEQMELIELEHAATRPEIFLLRLEKHDQQTNLRAYRKQFIDFTDFELPDNDFATDGTFKFLYVVPGGRFLITTHLKHFNQENYLNIWDVGWAVVPGSQSNDGLLIPIATLDAVPGNKNPVHPTRDGKGLLLFTREDSDPVAVDDGKERTQYFYIWEIYPKATLPSLDQDIGQDIHCVGKIFLEVDGVEQCCFNSKYMAMIFDHARITVWNFVNHTSLTWTSPVLYDDDDVTSLSIILHGNRVIVIRLNDLLIWDIPDLYPHIDGLQEVFTIMPIWTCPLNQPLDRQTGKSLYYTVQKLDNWYMGSSGPTYFDFVISIPRKFEDYGISQPSVIRYRLDIPDSLLDSDGNNLPPNAVCTQIANFYHLIPIPEWDNFGYRISHGSLFDGRIHYDRDLIIHTHSGTPSAETSPNAFFARLQLPSVPPELMRFRDNHAAVCPSSGRIFLFLQRYSDAIVILDLLPDPRRPNQPFCDMSLTVYDPLKDRSRFNRIPRLAPAPSGTSSGA